MSAKEIRVQPIDSKRANALVEGVHYSGGIVPNSQLHVGVFYRGVLEGAMQLGPPMVKRHALPLVPGTPWHGMMELNRMAFSDRLPRNSESRALGILCRMLRKHKPDLQWIQTYADATQCGDGTIYRAAGFLLVGIKRNSTIFEVASTGSTFTDIGYRTGPGVRGKVMHEIQVRRAMHKEGRHSVSDLEKAGHVRKLRGHMLRYVKFLDPRARARLAVEPIPYAKIAEVGASMYLGKRAGPVAGPNLQVGTGGASPTPALFSQPGGPPCGD